MTVHMALPLLEVRDLSLQLGPDFVLQNVSLHIGRGEVLALVGESGCGKTVACLAMLGLHPGAMRVVSGSVRLDGAELTTLSDRQMQTLRGRRIAMIFQDPGSALNPVHRIGDMLVRLIRLHRGLGQREAVSVAVDLLDRVGIPQPRTRMTAYPHELSGGMNQRVMIAASLAGEPDLLIADEPTTALDVTTQAQILDLLRDVQRETGMAMILISHDLAVVARIASRVVVMYCGRVVETGAADTLFSAPAHPYTGGLIASMPPHPASAQAEVRPIRGMVAQIGALPGGCHFHPRCDWATAACATGLPPQRRTPDRAVLCHHPLIAVPS